MTRPWPGPAIGLGGYRALHSFLVDALLAFPCEVRDAIVARLDGLSFVRFLMAIDDGRLVIRVRLHDDAPVVSVSVPTTTGDTFDLVVAQGTALGVDGAALMLEQRLRLQAALDDVVRGDW